MIGKFSRVHFLTYFFLFLGSVSVGFSIIGQTHFAIICMMLGAMVQFFNGLYQLQFDQDEQEESFSLELENLSKMVSFGLAPATLLMTITKGDFFAVLAGSVYLLAVTIRLAHFNRPVEWQGAEEGDEGQGLFLSANVLILPVLHLFFWFLPAYLVVFIWSLVFILVSAGFLVKFKLPTLPKAYQWAPLALGVIEVILLFLQGPVK